MFLSDNMGIESVRADFPLLQKKVDGRPFIYFDSACTALKPKQVIDAVVAYYSEYTACAGRSVHKLARRTTDEFEGARKKVARFINAARPEEIIWTRNTTEAINLVAHGFAFKPGDKVLTTNLEHSSGLLPWQDIAASSNVTLDFVQCSREGELSIEDFKRKIDRKTKLVSVIHASNVMGTRAPLAEIVKIAHENGALVLADAAQSVPHFPVDVRKLDVDFLAFSGHKMCGPTGIGCLYGKKDMLEQLRPQILGGETILDADMKSFIPAGVPQRFEGGIQHYAGAIGLGAAIDYLSSIGTKKIEEHEKELAKLLLDGLKTVKGVELLGPSDHRKRGALAAFNIKGMAPHDIALMLNEQNIFVRSGMHCAYPLHKALGLPGGSARASLYFYNTKEEVSTFVEKLGKIAATFG